MDPLKFEGDYSHAAMLERAVRNARPRLPGKHPRWTAVMDTLTYGSTTSTQLCHHFGLDPHEMIEGCGTRAHAALDTLLNNSAVISQPGADPVFVDLQCRAADYEDAYQALTI